MLDLSLEHAVDRLGQGVVVTVSDASDRGADAPANDLSSIGVDDDDLIE